MPVLACSGILSWGQPPNFQAAVPRVTTPTIGKAIVSADGSTVQEIKPKVSGKLPVSKATLKGMNEAFAYSRHKGLVEGLLAQYRDEHPELEQVVLRIGTILGRTVDNQITALFQRKRLPRIAGSDSPFVFIWDEDLVAIVLRAVTGDVTGTFNVAGDGAMTIQEIARELDRPVLTIPEPVLRAALAVAKPLGLTQYGPEQTKFLQYRPVLDNTRLKHDFGLTPTHTTREAFAAWRTAQVDRARA